MIRYVEKVCEKCKKPYSVRWLSPFWRKKRRFCSVKCSRHFHRLSKRKCIFCKGPFAPANKNQKFCSNPCQTKLLAQRRKDARKKQWGKNQRRGYVPTKYPGIFDYAGSLLTLKNYKEPLTQIPLGEGVGWFGVLSSTVDGTGIQCHVCGEIVKMLPGHIYNVHGIKTKQYRAKYGLSPSTALFSEDLRLKNKQRTLEFIKSLTKKQRKDYLDKGRERCKMARGKRSSFYPKKSLEQKNKEGVCPEQLLERIKNIGEKLGHVPSKDEYQTEEGTSRYLHLIRKTFGGWDKAVEMCHFRPEDDLRRVHHHLGGKRRSDEDLLEYLRIYTQENQQIPTATDFKRDFLPDLSAYRKRWGSIERARQEAGVYQILDAKKPSRWNSNLDKS